MVNSYYLTKYFLLLSAFLMIAGGCSVDVNPPSAVTSPPVVVPEVPKTHTELAVLNLVRTNQELKQVKSNALTVRGSGKAATYKLEYAFYSGHVNRLQVMQMTSQTSSGDCAKIGPTKTTLFSRDLNIEKEIGFEQQAIMPNTNYSLVISVGPNDCDDFQATHTPIVWADFVTTTVDPKFAITCQGSKSGTISFFRQLGLMTAFSESSGKTFLSLDVHCGETLSGKVTAGMSRSSGIAETFVEGYFKSKSDNYEFKLVSTDKQASHSLLCTKNNIVTHDEQFADCRESVKDVTPYQR